MQKADLMAMHASAQHIMDYAKSIQELVEKDLNNQISSERLWENDLTRVTTKAYSELDSVEIIMKHNRIMKESGVE